MRHSTHNTRSDMPPLRTKLVSSSPAQKQAQITHKAHTATQHLSHPHPESAATRKVRTSLSPFNVKTLSVLAGGSSCTHSVIPVTTAAIKALAAYIIRDASRFATLKRTKRISGRLLTRTALRFRLPIVV
jgi:hypothetical protein